MADAPHIFLSYRRDDSADITGRIYDRLVQRFEEATIFRDIDAIPLGVDFRAHLNQMVGRCHVLLAILGPNWVKITDAKGNRRLDDPGDFVRLEVEIALTRTIPVVPLLVYGATMPQEADLPASLKELAYRNGIPIRRDPDFHHDVDRLIESLQTYLPGVEQVPAPSASTVTSPAQTPTFNLSGNIRAGQVNMGGTQTFQGPVEVDMRETHVHQPQGEVVMGDKIDISGDFRGALVNVKSQLENVTQIIHSLPTGDEESKTELLKLIEELKAVLSKVPEEKVKEAEKVSNRVEALTREISEKEPDKEMISMTGESLKRAVKNIADVLPSVIPLAAQIVTVALKFHGS